MVKLDPTLATEAEVNCAGVAANMTEKAPPSLHLLHFLLLGLEMPHARAVLA
jgi:hypothetical protein